MQARGVGYLAMSTTPLIREPEDTRNRGLFDTDVGFRLWVAGDPFFRTQIDPQGDIFRGPGNTAMHRQPRVAVGTTAPTNPAVGDLWVDTNP